MSEVFEAKLRKIGNSLGVIIPKEIIEDLHFHQGDSINVCIPSSDIKTRNEKIKKLAGKYKNTSKFKREKVDRF